MKYLFFINLFIVCCNSFILQSPSFLPSNNKFNSITPIFKPSIKNKLVFLKKYKYDDEDDVEHYKEEVTKLSINIIYNVILYSYIIYLLNLKNII
jgi:hypothetical protein